MFEIVSHQNGLIRRRMGFLKSLVDGGTGITVYSRVLMSVVHPKFFVYSQQPMMHDDIRYGTTGHNINTVILPVVAASIDIHPLQFHHGRTQSSQ